MCHENFSSLHPCRLRSRSFLARCLCAVHTSPRKSESLQGTCGSGLSSSRLRLGRSYRQQEGLLQKASEDEEPSLAPETGKANSGYQVLGPFLSGGDSHQTLSLPAGERAGLGNRGPSSILILAGDECHAGKAGGFIRHLC